MACLTSASRLRNQSGQHLLRECTRSIQTFQHFILIALLLILGCLDSLLGSLFLSVMFSILMLDSLFNALVIRLTFDLAEQLISIGNHSFIYPFCQI